MRVYKIEEIADKVRPIAKSYGTGKIYLFGSYARGEANENSDIDLLVDAENVHGLCFFALYDDLEEALEKKLDLVTVNALYNEHKDDRLVTKLRTAIEKDGVLIYDR